MNKELPKIHLVDEEILASNNKGETVTGVQKKFSIYINPSADQKITLFNNPLGYIVKPDINEFNFLPEAEHLVMCMAEEASLSVVPHALVKVDDKYAYITKRIDREYENNQINKIAMEDFCQLQNKLTETKYVGSYEKCGKTIDTYSSIPGADKAEFFLRLVFCFITGNSDMHLKNFSLIETNEGYKLSPAYDLLPVNIIMPDDKEECALTLNGKKMNITKNDFIKLAYNLSIPKPAAIKMIESMIQKENTFVNMVEESLLSNEMKESFIALIHNRIARLK